MGRPTQFGSNKKEEIMKIIANTLTHEGYKLVTK